MCKNREIEWGSGNTHLVGGEPAAAWEKPLAIGPVLFPDDESLEEPGVLTARRVEAHANSIQFAQRTRLHLELVSLHDTSAMRMCVVSLTVV